MRSTWSAAAPPEGRVGHLRDQLVVGEDTALRFLLAHLPRRALRRLGAQRWRS